VKEVQKKLTITIDERVYKGLHNVIGRRRISRFIESLVRPHVIGKDLDGSMPLLWMSPMKRGEVWWVIFETSVGGEIRKQRPAVIVSNDGSNKHLNRVQVVPLTSAVDRVYPSEAAVMNRGKKHKAMADQLTTVSKSRLDNRIGRLSKADLEGVEEAIRVQLGLIL
jgi:mRNA interferase MazF